MKRFSRVSYFVGSGKGGVGKSTVAVNLAVACAKQGFRVGILDADIYGPSIPIMTGLRRMSPHIAVDFEGKKQIIPFTKYGIHIISIGFFIEEAQSVLWRGPMLHGILKKMIHEVDWPELDFLFIDLPPGTGDVPLSMTQLLQVDGALIVSTPQAVATLDAWKAINAFDQLQIPVVGIIENMAGFAIPGTDQIAHIFGQGKAQELADKFMLPLLASIPLIPAIREGGDEGCPSAFHQGDRGAGNYFWELSQKITQGI